MPSFHENICNFEIKSEIKSNELLIITYQLIHWIKFYPEFLITDNFIHLL